MPIARIRAKESGTAQRSKKGRPTPTVDPWNASISRGKECPHKHDEREHGEQEIVQQEHAFATDE